MLGYTLGFPLGRLCLQGAEKRTSSSSHSQTAEEAVGSWQSTVIPDSESLPSEAQDAVLYGHATQKFESGWFLSSGSVES